MTKVCRIVGDFAVSPETSECSQALQPFKLAADVGIPIKSQKTVRHSTTAEVHGILVIQFGWGLTSPTPTKILH